MSNEQLLVVVAFTDQNDMICILIYEYDFASFRFPLAKYGKQVLILTMVMMLTLTETFTMLMY